LNIGGDVKPGGLQRRHVHAVPVVPDVAVPSPWVRCPRKRTITTLASASKEFLTSSISATFSLLIKSVPSVRNSRARGAKRPLTRVLGLRHGLVRAVAGRLGDGDAVTAA